MSTKPWKNKDHIHLDRQSRTEKGYVLLALIFAANQSMKCLKENPKYKAILESGNLESIKNNEKFDKGIVDEIVDCYKADVVKRLRYSLNLFKANGAGTYGTDEEKVEDQFYRTYTPGLELGVFINSELDLSENAIKVANGEITIRQYFDETYFNFICIVNNKSVHVIYEILIYMKRHNINKLNKDTIKSIFEEKIDSDGLKTVIEWMLSGNIFFKSDDEYIEISSKYSLDNLISECNLKYYNKTLNEIKESELHNQKQYAEYITNNSRCDSEKVEDKNKKNLNKNNKEGENRIYYGAPGTGKSHTVEEIAKNEFDSSYRTTFYPEYTHDDFIGSFMPVMNYEKQNPPKEYLFGDGTKSDILGKPVPYYTFVPGPFANALVDAMNNPNKNVLLIIEELNRANAAAVFGEVFQLLDRKIEGKDTDGESRYEINISNEFSEFLASKVGKYNISEKIKIPFNLSIYATMNSADQGVNPLDSAFKRRWNFVYVPIDFEKAEHKDCKIQYAGKKLTWQNFGQTINNKLIELNINEDKLLGEYFVNPVEVEDEDKFSSKVISYLFDDVFKFSRRGFFKPEYKTFSQLKNDFSQKEIFDFSFDYNETDNNDYEENNESADIAAEGNI